MDILNFKLSIIIPIYNNSQYVKPLLNSLVKQKKDKKVEIIAVDDGSTQDMSFLDTYNEIIVIHKQNGGCASARNAGLRAARGEYIAFLDADDSIVDNYLDTIYNDAFLGYDYVTYRYMIDRKEIIAGKSKWDWRPNYNCWSYLFKKSITEGKWFDERRNAADDWPWVQSVTNPELKRYDSSAALVIYNTHNYNSLTKRVQRGEISEFKNEVYNL